MTLQEQMRDNLFSANHRSKMIALHGYTEAMRVTVDDLLFEMTMEAQYQQESAELSN